MINNKYRQFLFYLDSIKKLGVYELCKNLRAQLTIFSTNPEILSEALTSRLKPAAEGEPYKLLPDDPEQVVILKKLINIFYHVEKIMGELNSVDLKEMHSKTEVVLRVLPKVVKLIYKTINQLYDAIHLLNNSTTSMNIILGPQIEKFAQVSTLICLQLQNLMGSKMFIEPEKYLGEMVGTVVSKLPTEVKKPEEMTFDGITEFIYTIPDYFKRLQQVIESETTKLDKMPSIETRDPGKQLANKAKLMTDDLEMISEKSGLRLSFNYFLLLKKLTAQSIDIINATAPTNRAAYLKLEEKINHLKHAILPELMAELESLEENLGLKSGVLTIFACEAAQQYYQTLILFVDKTIAISNTFKTIEQQGNKWYGRALKKALPKESRDIRVGDELKKDEKLKVLFDDIYFEEQKKLDINRLNQEQEKVHALKSSLIAAEKFLHQLEKLNPTAIDGNFASLSLKERQELTELYIQFQEEISSLDSDFDREVVRLLNPSKKELEAWGRMEVRSPMQNVYAQISKLKLYHVDLGYYLTFPLALIPKGDEIKTIIIRQKKLLEIIRTSLITQTEKLDRIKEHLNRVTDISEIKSGEKTSLSTIISLPELKTFTFEKDKPPEYYYHQIILIDNERRELEETEAVFANFVAQLKKLPASDHLLSSLPEDEKELLRARYKKMQKTIYYLSQTNELFSTFDQQIVSALMGSSILESTKSELTIEKVLGCVDDIKTYIHQQKMKLEAHRKLYSRQEKYAQQSKSKEVLILQPAKIKTKRGSLFEQLSDLKLSEKLDNYQTKVLIPYFKKNLASDIRTNLNLENPDTPYTIIPGEAEQIIFYKNLLNAFNNLKQALRAFEKQVKHEYTDVTWQRGYFLASLTLSGIFPLLSAVDHIKKLKGTIQFSKILERGLKLVAPLIKILKLPFPDAKHEETKEFPEKKWLDSVRGKIQELQIALLQLMGDDDIETIYEKMLCVEEKFLANELLPLMKAESSLGLENGVLLKEITHFLQQVRDIFITELSNQQGLMDAIYDKLRSIFYDLDSDYSDKSLQKNFRSYYKILQPFLIAINPEYDSKNFLKKLVTTEDYEEAFAKIIKKDGKRLIGEIKKATKQNILSTMLSNIHDLNKIAQKILIERKLLPQPTSTPPVDDAKKEASSTLIRKLLTSLYQLKIHVENSALSSEKSSAEIKDFMKEINELSEILTNISIKPKQIQKFLNAIKKIMSELNNTTAKSHHLILEQLIAIRTNFNASLILELDNLEFNLGLKPGVLSQKYAKVLDDFFMHIMQHMALSSEQNDLSLLIDTARTEKRILNEKIRQDFYRDHPTANKIKELFWGASVKPTEKSLQKLGVFQRLKEFQCSLQKNPKLIEAIFFRDALLKCFEEIIPYLRECTIVINTGLEYALEPEDIAQVLTDILNLEPQIVLAIDSAVKADRAKLHMIDKRINYLTEQLKKEKLQGALMVSQFKDLKFSQFIEINVLTLLYPILGPYAEAFNKHLSALFLEKKESLLTALTMKDNIEESISTEMTTYFHTLMELIKKPINIETGEKEDMRSIKEAFKNFQILEHNYFIINKIKNQCLNKELNRYPQFQQYLVKKISSFEERIKKFTAEYNISDSIHDEMDYVKKFLGKLESYQLLVLKNSLEPYEYLLEKRRGISKEALAKNPMAQEFYKYLKKCEGDLIEKVNSTSSSPSKTISLLVPIYDHLIKMWQRIEDYLQKIKGEEAVVPETYVHVNIYNALLNLRTKINNPDYLEIEMHDKSAFLKYYALIQPLLKQRNPKFTPEYYNSCDNLIAFKRAISELTPPITSKDTALMKKIGTLDSIKKIIERENILPEQREKLVRGSISQLKTVEDLEIMKIIMEAPLEATDTIKDELETKPRNKRT